MGVNGITNEWTRAASYEPADPKKAAGKSGTAGSVAGKNGAAGAQAAEAAQGAKKSLFGGVRNAAPLMIQNSQDYGKVIGEPKLSDKAAEYYEKLKSKFGNLDFVLVSGDKKAAANAQAGRFGNANKTVVLIDEEKLERMATDESFRKKYEGIIASAQTKLQEMSATMGANSNVTSFGMKVDKNGNTSFFATVKDSSAGQKERIERKREEHRAEKKAAEKKAAEKREHQRIEKRKAEKEALEERLEKAAEERAEGADPEAKAKELPEHERPFRPGEGRMITAATAEELVAKISDITYAYGNVAAEPLTVGGSIDFKG